MLNMSDTWVYRTCDSHRVVLSKQTAFLIGVSLGTGISNLTSLNAMLQMSIWPGTVCVTLRLQSVAIAAEVDEAEVGAPAKRVKVEGGWSPEPQPALLPGRTCCGVE